VDELWTSAKHIAQSDGRKDDWVYVIDVYKSIGGTGVALMIFTEGKRLEIIGEINQAELLACSSIGELEVIDKSLYTRARKKFLKRDIAGAKPVKKSLTWKDKTFSAIIYKDAKLSS
jgi:hypothetical protein